MKVILSLFFVFLSGVALILFYVAKMPGTSPPASSAMLTEEEKDTAESMKLTCETLAHQIGQRSTAKASNLVLAREFLGNKLHKMGLHPLEKQFASRGLSGTNVEAMIEGNVSSGEVLVLGAHYDSEAYSPGAGDNASGCAMLLEVAREMCNKPHARTIEVVFFDFGSARFAGTADAGSHFWVEDAKKSGMKVSAMISFDAVGTFSDAPGTQNGPFPLSLCYPKQGNFLMFAGDLASRQLVMRSVEMMRKDAVFPTEGLTLPGFVPGLDSSDHAPFRKSGWPAMVITDTGPYRNSEDGQPSDTPDRLNYDRMAVAWTAIVKLVERLSQGALPTVVSVN